MSFEVFCGADGFAVALDACKPLSFKELFFVGNTAVDTRAYLSRRARPPSVTRTTPRQEWLREIPPSPAPVRQMVPSSRRSFAKRCPAAFPGDDNGNLVPDGEVFFPAPASATCHALGWRT